MKRRSFDWLWTGLLHLYTSTMDIVPLSVARLGGRLTGRLAYCILPGRRRVGMSNLDRVYGDTLTQREKVAILKASFESLAITMAEFSRIPELCGRKSRRYVHVDGLERIDL